jgi:hypothetical protein
MLYGNGHYVRSGGSWFYALTMEPVPEATDRRIDGRLVLEAPEVHPESLLSIEQAARICGVQPRSWRVMVSRRLAPAPVFRFGGSPVWTRGVLAVWLRTRPGHGGRPPLDG